MKKYFVKYSDFANSYALRSAVLTVDALELMADGYERITRKEAETLARRERQRRRENPNFSGYADANIIPYRAGGTT